MVYNCLVVCGQEESKAVSDIVHADRLHCGRSLLKPECPGHTVPQKHFFVYVSLCSCPVQFGGAQHSSSKRAILRKGQQFRRQRRGVQSEQRRMSIPQQHHRAEGAAARGKCQSQELCLCLVVTLTHSVDGQVKLSVRQ